MDTIELPEASVEAYLRLIELNLGSWHPRVSAWLHRASGPMDTCTEFAMAETLGQRAGLLCGEPAQLDLRHPPEPAQCGEQLGE